jgi:hypothetical protein
MAPTITTITIMVTTTINNSNNPPQYFVQLDSILKIGECAIFDVDDCSKFGRIINYESDNNKNTNKVIINEYIPPQEGSRFG